jgi:hypothetical protein
MKELCSPNGVTRTRIRQNPCEIARRKSYERKAD